MTDMNVKNEIEQRLNQAGIKFKFIPLPENLLMDIASHVAFHKIEMKQAMATIIYRTENGLVGAVKRADTQIDQEKLKQLVEVKQLQFATDADLAALGVESGLVPFAGLPIPYFVDAKVLAVRRIYGTGGSKTLGMSMEAKDLLKANGGMKGDFTVFEKSKEMLERGKQRILSGITPSGDGMLHIGNYLGAVRQFAQLARSHDCFLFIADLHALTTVQNREQLKKNTETLILNELALLMGDLGDDLSGITFFRQSDVPLHTELQSILNNVTPLGLLKRAHAYKDKLNKDVMEDDINVGLFSYPMLMAADILIYKPDLVPVGKDQKQHIEITRDIAERFNKTFSVSKRVRPSGNSRSDPDVGVFKHPEPYIPEEVAVILGTDGKRKMSKSLGNIISIFEDEAIIRKQVNSTYTDPTRKHATDPGHIEGNTVFSYLDYFGDKEQVTNLKEKYENGQVADVEVKEYLFESLMKTFGPSRKYFQELKNSPEKVKDILQNGAERAMKVATSTMQEVREVIGLTNQYSFFRYQERLALRANQGLTPSGLITIDDFARVEQRVGKVIEAKNVEKSEKLIRLTVDFGSSVGQRIIFTGVRPFGYTPGDFLNKQFLFVVNLEPRKMPSYVESSEGKLVEYSQGMILAVDGDEGKPVFVTAEGLPLGEKVR